MRWGVLGVCLAGAVGLAACTSYSADDPLDPDMMTANNEPGSGGSSASNGSSGSGTSGSGTSGSGTSGSGATSTAGTGDMAEPGGLSGMGGDTATGSGGSTAVDPSADACPEDDFKTQPGVCGCGVPDLDVDTDGTLDCEDECPDDGTKTEAGVCGCGRPDTDTDNDGTLDCNDGCPFDVATDTAGTCGCGAPANLQLCLRHRYSFNGNGAVATDAVGNANGTIVNATLAGNGTLVLQGVTTDQYVDLPANIISRLGPSATIEAWVTWTGQGAPWQRIFDFGSSELPPPQQGNGVTYLFLTPTNSINQHLRAAFTTAGPPAERVVNSLTALPFDVETHVALVVNGPGQTLTLYQNGAVIDVPAPTVDTTLAALNDVNNWIGRSQFAPDEEFQGTLNEFRIYSAARSAQQIMASFNAGPNNLPNQ